MRPIRDPDELWCHTNAAVGFRRSFPAHGTVEHVLHAEFLPDLPDRLPMTLVLKGGGTTDDSQPTNLGEPARDLLCDPIGEVVVGRIAQVLEGDYNKHPPSCDVD